MNSEKGNSRKLGFGIWQILLIMFFALHLILWSHYLVKMKPKYGITPNIPSKKMVDIISLGDRELMFRILALRLQNAGDTYGDVTPITSYDFKKVSEWLKFLDWLNPYSDYTPTLASYYYGATSDKTQLRYIVDYLYDRANTIQKGNWNWYGNAAVIAKNRLGDKKLAKEIGVSMLNNIAPNAPPWGKFFGVFINLDEDNYCDAFKLIASLDKDILKGIENDKILNIQDGDANYVVKALTARIQSLKNLEGKLKLCNKNIKHNAR